MIFNAFIFSVVWEVTGLDLREWRANASWVGWESGR